MFPVIGRISQVKTGTVSQKNTCSGIFTVDIHSSLILNTIVVMFKAWNPMLRPAGNAAAGGSCRYLPKRSQNTARAPVPPNLHLQLNTLHPDCRVRFRTLRPHPTPLRLPPARPHAGPGWRPSTRPPVPETVVGHRNGRWSSTPAAAGAQLPQGPAQGSGHEQRGTGLQGRLHGQEGQVRQLGWGTKG